MPQQKRRLTKLDQIIRRETRRILSPPPELERTRKTLIALAISFKNTRDSKGKLRYPKFNELHQHMGWLMEVAPELAAMPDGKRKLHKAYQLALIIPRTKA